MLLPIFAAFASPSLSIDSEHQDHRLANGLLVHLRPNAAPSDSIELRLSIRVGLDDDPAGLEGMAHLVEHLAFNGTERFPGTSITTALQPFGVHFGAHQNASTSGRRTTYRLSVPVAGLQAALDVLAQQAWSVAFNPAEVEAERPVVRAEDDMRRLGSEVHAGLEAIEAEDAKQFYETWYRPGNTDLVVVGDLPPETLAAIEKTFGPWTPGTVPDRGSSRLGSREQVVVLEQGPIQLASLTSRPPRPGASDLKRAAALLVASEHIEAVVKSQGGMAGASDGGVELAAMGETSAATVADWLGGVRADGWTVTRDELRKGWSSRPWAGAVDNTTWASALVALLEEPEHRADPRRWEESLGEQLDHLDTKDIDRALGVLRDPAHLHLVTNQPLGEDLAPWLRRRYAGAPALAAPTSTPAPSTPDRVAVEQAARNGPVSMWRLPDSGASVLYRHRPEAKVHTAVAVFRRGSREWTDGLAASEAALALQGAVNASTVRQLVAKDAIALGAREPELDDALTGLLVLLNRSPRLRLLPHDEGTVWVLEGSTAPEVVHGLLEARLAPMGLHPVDSTLPEHSSSAILVSTPTGTVLSINLPCSRAGAPLLAMVMHQHLHASLREERGLVYNVGIEWSALEGTPPTARLTISMVGTEDSSEAIAEALRAEVATLRLGVSATDYETVRQAWKQALVDPDSPNWVSQVVAQLRLGTTAEDLHQGKSAGVPTLEAINVALSKIEPLFTL